MGLLRVMQHYFSTAMTIDLTQAPTQACQTCGTVFTQGREVYFEGSTHHTRWCTNSLCWDCEQAAYFNRLSADQQQQVDDLIYRRSILEGIKLLKQYASIGLKEGTGLYSWRYRRLKETNPRKLPASDEQYWAGFYS